MELYLAFLIDLILGQPPNRFHLVAWLGRLLSMLENLFRKISKNNYINSFLLFFFINIIYYYIYIFFIKFDLFLTNIILVYFSFTFRGMVEHVYPIYIHLKNHHFEKAKSFTQQIVSRTIKDNDNHTIIRSAIESISENYVDSFVSPLFYFLLGYIIMPDYSGFFAFYYRIFNTCDAMFGYKNEQYKEFGFIFAKYDDLLNFLPARISFVFIYVASILLGYNHRNCYFIWKRDKKKHPSPNGGNPEAAFAGALEIQLGGVNYYFNKKEFRPFIGDKIQTLNPIHVVRSIHLFIVSSFLYIDFIFIVRDICEFYKFPLC
ncbi:MAG: adenosylcobinamide-phosphate synthase CbiB [Leptonema sp. (in: bacteria)]